MAAEIKNISPRECVGTNKAYVSSADTEPLSGNDASHKLIGPLKNRSFERALIPELKDMQTLIIELTDPANGFPLMDLVNNKKTDPENPQHLKWIENICKKYKFLVCLYKFDDNGLVTLYKTIGSETGTGTVSGSGSGVPIMALPRGYQRMVDSQHSSAIPLQKKKDWK